MFQVCCIHTELMFLRITSMEQAPKMAHLRCTNLAGAWWNISVWMLLKQKVPWFFTATNKWTVSKHNYLKLNMKQAHPGEGAQKAVVQTQTPARLCKQQVDCLLPPDQLSSEILMRCLSFERVLDKCVPCVPAV